MDEKLRFLEEKKLGKAIKAEAKTEPAGAKQPAKGATNPIATAFLKFVHSKHKFNIEDL